jgi:hypothetical protein
MTIFSTQYTGLQHETPSEDCDFLCLWQLHSKILLFLNNCILFSVARGAIFKLIIASIFVCALDNLWAISEVGNILLNRTEVQSAVLYLL